VWSHVRSQIVALVLLIALTPAAQPVSAEELSPAQVYSMVSPATVLVYAVSEKGGTTGTGSIIDKSGLVLTNAHVILDKATDAPYTTLFIFLKPARVSGRDQDNLIHRHKATVVAYQPALDLALLKIMDAPPAIPVLAMGNSGDIVIGSRVLAVGHPERGGLWSLTTGVISAEWKDYGGVPGWDVFQTETSLNRGNSGGPLVNGAGQQIGVNSFIQRKSDDGLAITSINFAIKSSVVKEWLARQGIQVAYAKADPRNEPTHGSSAPLAPVRTQPTKMQDNQPEAQPETGAGLPPLRPFSLDQLVKGLAQTQKDLESQMDDMQAEIRKRRR